MKLNNETKLVFALEHVAHLHDLIKGNEYEHYLNQSLTSLEYELERQLSNELHRKNPKLGKGIQGKSNKEIIKAGIGAIGRITDEEQ